MGFEGELDFMEDNLLQQLIKVQQKQIDSALCKFLEDSGYKVEKPYNIKQLEEIKLDLKKQHKFLNFINYTEYENEGDSIIACHYVLPFFDSINNPLDEDYKQELMERFKKLHKEKGNNNYVEN